MMRLRSDAESEFPHTRAWPAYMASSAAKAFPPKHTSMRHCFEAMNLFSFALHAFSAILSFNVGQLLMSGLYDTTMGVFPPGNTNRQQPHLVCPSASEPPSGHHRPGYRWACHTA